MKKKESKPTAKRDYILSPPQGLLVKLAHVVLGVDRIKEPTPSTVARRERAYKMVCDPEVDEWLDGMRRKGLVS